MDVRGFPPLWLLASFLTCMMATWVGALAAPAIGEILQSPVTLTSGSIILTCKLSGRGSGLNISLGFKGKPTASFSSSDPLRAEIVNAAFKIQTLRGSYQSVKRLPSGLECRGILRSPAGTVLNFVDRYVATATGLFQFYRKVTVEHRGRTDVGFATRFSLWSTHAMSMPQSQFFVPGIWYATNKHLPRHALAANYKQRRFIFRQDRMPMPLIMLRDPATRTTLTLLDSHPAGASFVGDQTPSPVCSARLKFASLGVVQRQKRLALTMLYPGSEGDTTYVLAGQRGWVGLPGHKGWVARYHPLRPGFTQRYQLLIKLGKSQTFNTALAAALSLGWRVLNPPVYHVSLPEVYKDQVELLNHYCQSFNGVEGTPYTVALPGGQVGATSQEIGFTGKEALNAYQLIRYGLKYHHPGMLKKGEAIIHFWVTKSPYPSGSGLFRTWFNPQPTPKWWNAYPTFLREVAGGARGILLAWNAEDKMRRSHPAWLHFCVRFAQWLEKQQHANGSFDRAFSFPAGLPIDTSKASTLCPVPFLVDMYRVTGHLIYLQMAVKAGNYGQKRFIPDSVFSAAHWIIRIFGTRKAARLRLVRS